MILHVVNRELCVGNIHSKRSIKFLHFYDRRYPFHSAQFDVRYTGRISYYWAFCTVITAGIRLCSIEQQMFIPSQLIP